MSQEKIIDTLKTFGLTGKEAEAYIVLAKSGPLTGNDLSRYMNRNKGQVYRLLKRLQKRGLVESTLESPTRFLAVSFEKALDMFVKTKRDEAALIEESTKDLLNDWEKIKKTRIESSLEKFIVINGKRKIFHKIASMAKDTKNQLCSIITVHDLLIAERLGVFDDLVNNLSPEITFQFLTDVSGENVKALKSMLDKIPSTKINFKGKNPEFGLKLSPRMVIRDNEEILFSIDSKSDSDFINQDTGFLWTNCQSLIQSFSSIFEELWRNGSNIEKKFKQLKSNKISNIKKSNKIELINEKYQQIILSANKEIIMMIPSIKLIEFWKNKVFYEKLLKKKISIKIMTPLTTTNLVAVKELIRIIKIRHIPKNYLETILVDGKYLFQFKTSSSDKYENKTSKQILDSFYTENPNHVKQIRKMLNYIWDHAQTPSSITLKSVIDPSNFRPSSIYPPLKNVKGLAVFIEDPTKLTENDVINKMSEKDVPNNLVNNSLKMFSSSAIALIHSPPSFGLPEMMISIDHIYGGSSYGKGNALMVFLKRKMPKGDLFFSSGGIGDNPLGVEHRKKVQFQNKIEGKNYRLVKKDKLQVRVTDSSLFASWTVPISLYPKYVLPPASILIEGYGGVKTSKSTLIGASGYKYKNQSNYFNAFVTFMHPLNKYSGPGTDGLFFRDLIANTIPPEKESR